MIGESVLAKCWLLMLDCFEMSLCFIQVLLQPNFVSEQMGKSLWSQKQLPQPNTHSLSNVVQIVDGSLFQFPRAIACREEGGSVVNLNQAA